MIAIAVHTSHRIDYTHPTSLQRVRQGQNTAYNRGQRTKEGSLNCNGGITQPLVSQSTADPGPRHSCTHQDMSRNTPPPLPPPKEYNSSRQSSYTNQPRTNTNYNHTDLAAAIRDTVHITPKSSDTSLRSSNNRGQGQYQHQSPNLHSSHSYTRSSPDMSHITQQQGQQPMLPSAMVQAVNPFDEDEIEPERRRTKGSAPPARQKVGRGTSS